MVQSVEFPLEGFQEATEVGFDIETLYLLGPEHVVAVLLPEVADELGDDDTSE